MGQRIVTVDADVEGASPARFLRLGEGEGRGFWARGARWAAHFGVAARVEVGERTQRHGSRYQQLREQVARLKAVTKLPDRTGRESERARPLRFFGGLSFREDHHPSGFWESFPPALFILPTAELVGDGTGVVRLRIRSLVPANADADPVRDALERQLADTLASLTAPMELPRPDVRARAQRSEMGRVTWDDAVAEALRAIRVQRFSKVVLARTLDVTTSEALDPVDVVDHLWRENPGTHVFLFEPHPGRPLLGAAPETIATLRGGLFHATAVAGSIARGASEEEQQELARSLLASHKDRQEHEIALHDMLERLQALADGVQAQGEPHVLTLARIQHLETEIRARVNGRGVLDVLEALHPTPAVCGLPRDAALEFLRGEESFDRGWYSGPVGFFDEDGNGVFAPALRTAVGHGRTWRLFAGAGIVSGSTPDLEWAETGIKFEPVLRALEASGASLGEGGGPREGDPQAWRP